MYKNITNKRMDSRNKNQELEVLEEEKSGDATSFNAL